MTRMLSSQALLLDLIDEAFDHKAWHGTTLLGAIRGVAAAQASWRPGPRRHNIWEVTVHGAYWKYAVRRRLTGEKRGAFSVKGSNWFRRPGPGGSSDWAADVKLLIDEHRRLREAVAACPSSSLRRRVRGSSSQTAAYIICGIAAHDLYHAGQIQLLKKLAGR